MKKILTVVLSGIIALASLGGCGSQNETDPEVPGQDAEIALLNTCESSVYSLAATDSLGRTFSKVSGVNPEKYVGLFYFLWQGQEPTKQTAIYDNTELLSRIGDEFWDGTEIFDSMPNQYHYWGEPLFGYYNSQDPWVMARHMEMLTFAGIDFFVFDTTNQFIYRQVWSVLFPIMEKFQKQGFAVPKIVFYTNTDSAVRTKELYDSLYSPGLYEDLWFKPNGKPIIICGEKSKLSSEIQNFFDFRSSQWPGMAKKDDGFPWIDFNRNQEVYSKGGAKGGSIMSVSVSQHPGWPFSDSVQYKDLDNGSGTYYNANWGRGYSTATGTNDISRVNEGSNFQEQWNNALQKDPSTVFVTGWNEWIAVKFYEDITVTTGVPQRPDIPNRRVFFVDTVNEEFSRDIEPMKGGYGDNYYLQLIENIRKYKGLTDGENIKGQKLTIDVNGSVSQWEQITDSFRDFTGDAIERNFKNSAGTYAYTDNSNRNDIAEIRLCHDDENVYVLVSTLDKITEYKAGDKGWMNLLIGVDGSKDKSFEGYNFVVNRNPSGNMTSIEQSLGGYAFKNIGEVKYSVKGKYIQFAIPKKLLGITDGVSLKIKVTDNITKPDDIMDYYVSGDSAPIGRLSYTWSI